MLDPSDKIAVYMEAHIDSDYGKMGSGVVRYLPNPIVGVIDKTLAGNKAQDFMPTSKDIPILASLTSAIASLSNNSMFGKKLTYIILLSVVVYLSCSVY